MRPVTHKKKDGRYQSYYNCPHHHTTEERTKIVVQNFHRLQGAKNGNPVYINGQYECNRKDKRHDIYPANKSDLAYEKAVTIHLSNHERKLHELKQAKASGTKTLSEINEKYKAHCKKIEDSKDNSKAMNSLRESKARLYILPELGDSPIGKISEKDLILFYENLHSYFIDEDLSDTLYNQIQVVLKSIIDYAYLRDYMKENPYTSRVSRTATNNRKKIKDSYVSTRTQWTSETVDLVTNFVYFLIEKSNLDPFYQKLSEYMLVTLHIGTRASETAGLQLDDFDLDDNKVHIQRQLVRNYGSKYNDHFNPIPEITKLKSKSSNRKIPISTDVKNLILRIDAEYEEGVRQPDILGNKSLWQDDEGVPLHSITFRTMLLRFLRNYGEEFKNKFGGKYKFQFHALRHACISTWLIEGVNPMIVKFWAGHSSLQMTSDRYGHFIESKAEHFNMSDVMKGVKNLTSELLKNTKVLQ